MYCNLKVSLLSGLNWLRSVFIYTACFKKYTLYFVYQYRILRKIWILEDITLDSDSSGESFQP